MHTESDLVATCVRLIGDLRHLTAAERAICTGSAGSSDAFLDEIRRDIVAGDDPLGSAFCAIRVVRKRRELGAVYTPQPIVRAMLEWGSGEAAARVIDPGAGSGRFVLGAAQLFKHAELIAVESDPLACLVLRANAAAKGVADRLRLVVGDFRNLRLPAANGRTFFVGNPPYVRHHGIAPEWKTWYASVMARAGFSASKLAGLHVHFIAKISQMARDGDYGCLITASEFLDVDYGRAPRRLLATRLGLESVHVLDPRLLAFDGALTTASISCFRLGVPNKSVRFRRVSKPEELNALQGGMPIDRDRLEDEAKWSTITATRRRTPAGWIQLGDLFGVHRGQVTGANDIWIAGKYPGELPAQLQIPAVTRAKELIDAGPVLSSTAGLRRIIDLPRNLDELGPEHRRLVDRFLGWATANGARDSYIARHRSPWWSVRLTAPAPILCTYMARRPPVFVRNACGARHVNIAHGLYPRDAISSELLDTIVAFLSTSVSRSSGRTYAGGLTKFEPKELERLLIPGLEELHARAKEMDAGRTGRRCPDGDESVPAAAAG